MTTMDPESCANLGCLADFAERDLLTMARQLTELRPIEPAPCALCAELGRPCLVHREADDWAACFAGIPSPITPETIP